MRILGMEAAVRQLIRFGNAPHILDDVAGAQPILVNVRRVADKAENRLRRALAVMDIHAPLFDLAHQGFNARFLCAGS